MNEYRIKAYAKINLGLDVVRRLENGYHEVKMVMQTVGIYDVLDFERTDGGIVITTDSGELPTDENNLIYKAVQCLKELQSGKTDDGDLSYQWRREDPSGEAYSHSSGHGRRQYGCSSYLKRNEPSV